MNGDDVKQITNNQMSAASSLPCRKEMIHSHNKSHSFSLIVVHTLSLWDDVVIISNMD